MAPDDLERAADWLARLDEAPDGASSDAARSGFSAWFRMRSDHRRAFAAVAAVDAVARHLADQPALAVLGDAALARAAMRPQRRRWPVLALAGTLVLTPVAALTIHRMTTPAPAAARVFTTAVGERRMIPLAGGARAMLDTASRLSLDGSTIAVRGQAYVVAGATPIDVRLPKGSATIAPFGRINLRTDTAGAAATLLAERAPATVSIDPAAPALVVPPGHVLSLRGGISRIAVAADAASMTSWREGWLLFDDVPLATAAAEINRYRGDPVRLARGTDGVRISGSFRTDDGAAFLKAAAAALPSPAGEPPRSPAAK